MKLHADSIKGFTALVKNFPAIDGSRRECCSLSSHRCSPLTPADNCCFDFVGIIFLITQFQDCFRRLFLNYQERKQFTDNLIRLLIGSLVAIKRSTILTTGLFFVLPPVQFFGKQFNSCLINLSNLYSLMIRWVDLPGQVIIWLGFFYSDISLTIHQSSKVSQSINTIHFVTPLNLLYHVRGDYARRKEVLLCR